MPDRLKRAVLSILNNLAGFFLGSFNLHNFPASVGAAGRTHVMRQLSIVTLRTQIQRWRDYSQM